MPVRRVLFWLVVLVLAAPALLLTAARAIPSGIGTVVRLESFTPLAIPLYTALVLIVSVGAVSQPTGRRTRRLVAVLVALCGLGVHVWWFSPQVLGDNPAPAAGARTITVMNSNLYEGAGDPDEVVAAVRRDRVDILVVEEITPDVLARMDEAGLAGLLPYRVGEPDPAVAGTMVFANVRLTDPVQLATTFKSYRVQVGSLTLLAVHPVAPVEPDGWRADHEVILQEAEDSDADLVVGDLNATADHVVMRDLDDAGFRDVGELANDGWQPTWPANHVGILPLLPPLVRIDHVLVSSTLAALGTHTVDIGGTDHLALVADIAVR